MTQLQLYCCRRSSGLSCQVACSSVFVPAAGGSTYRDIIDTNVQYRYSDDVDIAGAEIGLDGNTTLQEILVDGVEGVPRGGFTLGDVMSQQYQAMNNGYAADLFKDTIIHLNFVLVVMGCKFFK